MLIDPLDTLDIRAMDKDAIDDLYKQLRNSASDDQRAYDVAAKMARNYIFKQYAS